MKKALIVGYGVVGKNIGDSMEQSIYDIHDPALGCYKVDGRGYSVGFICVPTPTNMNGECIIEIVKEAVAEVSNICEVICIRSTIPPGTTEYLKTKYKRNIIFQPEYYGGTIHANYHTYNYIILGGERMYTKQVAEFYKSFIHPDTKIIQTNDRTAELCKYMENCWLAAKVTFVNEFRKIADTIDVDFNELRELWLLDPRINRSHTFSYDEQPYYDSHCLNKDIPALIQFAVGRGHLPSLMLCIDNMNKKAREENEK